MLVQYVKRLRADVSVLTRRDTLWYVHCSVMQPSVTCPCRALKAI